MNLVNFDKWMQSINLYKEPMDDLDRSEAQYTIIKSLDSKRENVIKDILAIPGLIVSIVISLFISCFRNYAVEKNVDAIALVIESSKVANLKQLGIPELIKKEYGNIKFVARRKRVKLFSWGCDKNVLRFWGKAFTRYPHKPYLLLSLWLHLINVNELMMLYSPRAIISTQSERDFSSSYITCYCEKNNVKNICVMHGEYLVSPYHCFVRFSKFYVWDKMYIEQFKKVRCLKNQFVVFFPKRFKMNITPKIKYEICYYLQDNNENSLMILNACLKKVIDKGYKCCIRPHPRVSDLNKLKDIFDERIEIENINDISIEESLGRSKYIVSQYSTVISEAINNGLLAVIDDVTDSEMIDNLKKAMYINLEKTELRFSSLLEKIVNC